MKKLILLLALVSSCVLGPGPQEPCQTDPGKYVISAWPRGQVSEFCYPLFGVLDLSDAATFQSTCHDGCTCTSDLTAPTTSCGPHQIVQNACGWPFLCTFSAVDNEPSVMTGICVQDWGLFSCVFDAWLEPT